MHLTAKSNSLDAQPIVLWLGADDRSEFQDAIALLSATSRLQRIRDPQRLAGYLASEGSAPALVVVAQSHPDRIGQDYIDTIRQATPQAKVLLLMGTWCEGTGRTAPAASDSSRLYWYEFPTWWHREQAPSLHPHLHNGLICRGLVVVDAVDWDTATAVADVLHHGGYATVWHPRGRPRPVTGGVTAGVWVGAQLSDREAVDLEAFCVEMAEQPALAILDFPRVDRVRAARAQGAAAVLSAPWQAADLINLINRASADSIAAQAQQLRTAA